MSARDRIKKLSEESNVNDRFVMEMFDLFIEAVKEECCAGELKWESPGICHVCPSKECADCFTKSRVEPDLPPNSTEQPPLWILRPWINTPPPPQKIQGYTAEQWQEIIDGGYVVEIGDVNGFSGEVILNILENDDMSLLETGGFHCRPSQIKGVMRPIFVEPASDEEAVMCMFFDKHGGTLSRKPLGYKAWIDTMTEQNATKYIEV